MLQSPPLRCPGLFITATDTGVGKTVATCAIAAALRRQQLDSRVGVCKPFASGCRREREGLVSEDAEALAHFADCRLPLDVINPIRFVPPLAPAVAAEQAGGPGVATDWDEIARSLAVLDEASDLLLIEGVGGLFVPLDPRDPKVTVLDLARALGFPVVVVTRSLLGTLNHTGMTVRLLRDAGVKVAGLVINGYDADAAAQADPSVATNRQWLQRMTGAKVLATIPRLPAERVRPEKGVLDAEVIEAVSVTWWPEVLKRRRG